MITPPSDSAPTALAWRGIHPIALSTHDLDATMRFYQDVLGMPVSDVSPAREGRGRHGLVVVKPGDSDMWGMHFFEQAAAGPSIHPTTPASGAGCAGRLLHFALRLPNEAATQVLRTRLHAYDIGITEITELGTFLFSDNTGILLEATWPQA